jgi:hypothetical protein
MVETKITYATPVVMTIGLDATPLGTSPTFILGRESTEVDNSSNLYVDAIITGKITTGATTADTQINIYVWGNHETIATNNLDTLDGTDSDETLDDVGHLNMFKLGAVIPVLDTTARSFIIPPFSIAQLFGGIMPEFWGLFVSHNTGVALDTDAADHEINYTGITFTSA